jgi:uncharacterized membrane protein
MVRATDKAGIGLLGGGLVLLLFLPFVAILVGGMLGLIESPGDALFLAVFVVGPFVVARQVSKNRRRDVQSSSSDTE